MSGNGHFWFIAVYFLVRDQRRYHVEECERFVKELVPTTKAEYVVYIAWLIALYGAQDPDYANILTKDDAKLTHLERNFLMVLRCLRTVCSQRANISALFLRTMDPFVYKCFNRLLEDRAAWRRLESINVSYCAAEGRPPFDLPSTALTAKEEAVAREYLPESKGEQRFDLSFPSLTSIGYYDVPIMQLRSGFLPRILTTLQLEPRGAIHHCDAAWRLFRHALRACPELQSATIILYHPPDSLLESNGSPQLTKLRFLKLQINAAFINRLFVDFLFPRLQELDVQWQYHSGDDNIAFSSKTFRDLRTLTVRTRTLRSSTDAEIDILKLLVLPSLERLTLDPPDRAAMQRLGLRIQTPKVLCCKLRGRDRKISDVLFDLDLLNTVELILDHPKLLTPLALPSPRNFQDKYAFPSLTTFEATGCCPSRVFDWVGQFVLPKIKVLKGLTGREDQWSADVLSNGDKVGLRSTERLSITTNVEISSVSQIPILQGTATLRLQVVARVLSSRDAPMHAIDLQNQIRALSSNAPLGPKSKCQFPYLEKLFVDCVGPEKKEIRQLLEAEYETLLSFRELQNCPPIELLLDGVKIERPGH
jgi:hypothetical protein